jgi:hypothetical protein
LNDHPSELRLLDELPGRVAIFALKNITIVVWGEVADLESVDRLARVGQERIRAYPRGLSDVHVIGRQLGLPDSLTRTRLLEESRQATSHLAAVAVVVGGSGFWASAIRGLVTGMHVLLAGKFELRLFAESEDLPDWLTRVHAQKTGIGVTPDELRDALREAREHAAVSQRRAS